MTNQDKDRYAILFHTANVEKLSRDSGFYTLSVVKLTENDSIRNGIGEWIEDLNFETFVYIGKDKNPEFCNSQVRYRDVHSVDLRRVEMMSKTLKKVEKSLDRLLIKPADFSQYVVLVGKALGIDFVAQDNNERHGSSFCYSDNTYTIRPIKDAQELISYEMRRITTAFEERNAPVAAAVSMSHAEWVDEHEVVRWLLYNDHTVPERLAHLVEEVEE